MSDWIQCSDEMPYAGHENQVWAYGEIDGKAFCFSAWFEIGFGWCSHHCREDSDIEVTHWMRPSEPVSGQTTKNKPTC